ncbi:MAG: hypothetical protein AAF928_10080 [Myxococcota bacterium]
MTPPAAGVAFFWLALVATPAAYGQSAQDEAANREKPAAAVARSTPPEEIDRVVVRWVSRATGGVRRPQFITARELAFEARLEAIVDGAARGRERTRPSGPPYLDKHIRSALERRIAESMLAQLPVDPKPSPRQVAIYAESARRIMIRRVAAPGLDARIAAGGGVRNLTPQALVAARRDAEAEAEAALEAARVTEGIARDEFDTVLRRRARASWYLDQTVAPMLRPSELDLREVHLRGESPYAEQPFDEIADDLRQWYVATRLGAALDRYFRAVRSKVQVTLIERPTRSTLRKRRRPPRRRSPRRVNFALPPAPAHVLRCHR